MTDHDEALLVIGRQRFPEWATAEAEAAQRLRTVLDSGDPSRIKEGVKAMADWVDARCAMVVYLEMEDATDSRKH